VSQCISSSNQSAITGLPEGFTLQNITDLNGNNVSSSDVSGGTTYNFCYGNSSESCCVNITT
ncbi:Hypothetical predicted protein, partial [Pelobates cultripes]